VQRPVLPPGTLAAFHPVCFLVITKKQVYGRPIEPDLLTKFQKQGYLTPKDFGLEPDQLNLVVIEPESTAADRKVKDVIGIVTTLEGEPLAAGDISSRLGGFDDVKKLEGSSGTDADLIELVLGCQNIMHNNYQDFQKFLDLGGKIGLQHDPLLYGAYALNPFLIRVDIAPMLVVEQGEVAVIKSYVGLMTEDVTGEEFKFGVIVKPGHRGIWREALGTGKYPINPHCYQAEIVPTAILTLNWAEQTSKAHTLDATLSQIVAKSREGFIFKIDLQVQIHVSGVEAPRVISMVGTMQNLVSEVLQAAVGNHFRDKMQSMKAVQFIETRQQVQEEAFKHIESKLSQYKVETKGVYIQDVILPEQMVKVLTEREIANQEIETFKKQRDAQEQRIMMEKSKGMADKQSELASSEVNITIKGNNAEARKKEADGEAYYTLETGRVKGAEVEAIGMAKAKAYKAQVEALGQDSTALVNAITALSDKGLKFVPDVMVSGGGSSIDGLAGVLMNMLGKMGKPPAVPAALQEDGKDKG
jgi:regulator of protease activity HflC (stomatin/prohibitin superfamily)